MANKGNTPSTIIRRISTVKSFYHFLQQEQYIIDETHKISLPKMNKALPDVLSIEETANAIALCLEEK